METIAIKSQQPFSLESVGAILSKHWRVEVSPGETLVVHGNKGRAYVHPDIESQGQPKHCLLVDYSDVHLVKRVVEVIANDPSVEVDNDFGTVLPGNDFVARCKAEPGWDWRR